MSTRPLLRLLGWASWVLVLWVFVGWVVAVLGGVVAVWHLWRSPSSAAELRVAAAVMASVPVAWVLGNAGRLGEVTGDVVSHNLAPHRLSAVALSLMALGVWREVLGSPGPDTSGEW